MKKEYTEKVVAYLDILGFTDKVDNSASNSADVEKIYRVVRRIYEGKRQNDSGVCEMRSEDLQISTFSDSIVISCPADKPNALTEIITHIIWVLLDLLDSGFTARGAISTGLLYHDGDVVFGPAMNEVHLLEETCAIYPRIVVSEKAILYYKGQNNSLSNIDLSLAKQLRIDSSDGFYFVDFLAQREEFPDSESYFDWLWKVRKLLVDELRKNKNQNKIWQKYSWMKHYFNTTLDSYKEIENRCPSRIEDFLNMNQLCD